MIKRDSSAKDEPKHGVGNSWKSGQNVWHYIMVFVEIILEPENGFHLFQFQGVYHKNPLWFVCDVDCRTPIVWLHVRYMAKHPKRAQCWKAWLGLTTGTGWKVCMSVTELKVFMASNRKDGQCTTFMSWFPSILLGFDVDVDISSLFTCSWSNMLGVCDLSCLWLILVGFFWVALTMSHFGESHHFQSVHLLNC